MSLFGGLFSSESRSNTTTTNTSNQYYNTTVGFTGQDAANIIQAVQNIAGDTFRSYATGGGGGSFAPVTEGAAPTNHAELPNLSVFLLVGVVVVGLAVLSRKH